MDDPVLIETGLVVVFERESSMDFVYGIHNSTEDQGGSHVI